MKKIFITGILLVLVTAALMAEFQELSGAAKKDLRSAGNYYRQKIFDKALGFYESVLESNPHHIESLYNIAGIKYEIDKDYVFSYNYYGKVLTAIDSLYAEYEMIKSQDEKEGKKYYKKYIKKEDIEEKRTNAGLLQSNCWKYLYKKGYDFYVAEDYESAITELKALCEMAPDSVLTIKMIANSYLKLENTENAIEYYIQAYMLAPAENEAQLIANRYFQLEDYENAADWYIKASELNPENADNYFNIGICYSNIDNKEDAIAMFSKTLEYAPENLDAVYNAKVLALQLNDADLFIKYSEKEFEINGYSADELKIFCFKLNSIEAFEAILTYGEKWAELAPSDPSPLQLMLNAANKTDNKEKAKELQKRLGELN